MCDAGQGLGGGGVGLGVCGEQSKSRARKVLLYEHLYL